ncbi:YegP family protein [Arthrobacter sp. efr-133-TYG-118]|uniref:YegP family protein n=1 Tax=Arthrobacter sp. efr-133-TYG-118 TaxID=3040279 RepID=UPI00254DBCE7|nr:YegP family protein [Arthrobacter sp. efr-133-TYG-118]
MAAQFRLYADTDALLRFELVTDNGVVLLTSVSYENEDAAIAAIWSVRETAANRRIVDPTGLVSEAPDPG